MQTRLDLNLASSILSSKVTKPNVDDSRKLEHVIGYLLGTKDKSITIVKGDNQLRVWVDTAYMVNSDLKGQTAYVIKAGDNFITPSSNKQQLTSLSTTESELIAMSETLKELINA